jgi:hypothetical protein
MGTNLTMVDDTVPTLVDKLDGILNGQNVVASGSICLVNDGGQGG